MLLCWILCAILFLIIIIVCLKLYILKRDMDEICTELEEHLSTDTNTLITISSGDTHICKLANELNDQLKILRERKQKYQNGDRELKNAITNVSHDLRTPLTAICGYLDLLENEEKSENAQRYILAIANRTQAMKQLTEDLFRYSVTMSNTEDVSRERVNLNAVLEESVASFYGVFKERNIVPTIKMPEDKIIRNLNKVAVARVLSNLLNNALKYSDGDLDIVLSEDGEMVFTNTASGLDAVQVGKLFDRFYTVEDARNSTGLGLAISKTLVEQMDGTITARYQDNRLSIHIKFNEVTE